MSDDQRNDFHRVANERDAPGETEYEHVRFDFRRGSMLLDGKYFQVSAFLLVPKDVMPELAQWQAGATSRDPQAYGAEFAMYKSLLARGCLLHRVDGPAYIETEKAINDDSYTGRTQEQFWENGALKARPLPDDDIRRLRLPTNPPGFSR